MSTESIVAIFLVAFLVLAVATFCRLVAGEMPDTKQDYGEGEPNEWEIR